jgi:crossover junction endodeoxyribonuclease RusA
MMEPIRFFVAGLPKGQPRPKAVKRGAHAGVYDPGTANEWKNQIYIQGKDFVPAVPLDMALRVDLIFYFPRPKAHFRSNGELKPNAPEYHTSKPDRDNLDKAVMDQMTAMRFWVDDSQAADGRLRKFYDDGRGPGVDVCVREAQ